LIEIVLWDLLTGCRSSPAAVPPATDDRTAVRWPVYALGAVSVLGFAGFTTFGLLGRDQESELATCRGACSDRAYDVMRDRYLVADISLGVAVVSLSAAAVLWFVGDRRERRAR
jgi:hypothetical protein